MLELYRNASVRVVAAGRLEEYARVDDAYSAREGNSAFNGEIYDWTVEHAMGFGERAAILLPDTVAMRNYVDGMLSILGFYEVSPPSRVIYGPDPGEDLAQTHGLLDRAILAHVGDVAELLGDGSHVVITHANTPEAQAWIAQVADSQHAFNPKGYDRTHFDVRGGFSSRIVHSENPSFTEQYGLPAPVGRTAYSPLDVYQAYNQVVEQTGFPLVYAKIAASGGGNGLKLVGSSEQALRQYEIWDKEGILGNLYGDQVGIEYQAFIPGIKEVCSFQYVGDAIVSPVGYDGEAAYASQLLRADKPTAWLGNVFGKGVVIDGLSDEERLKVDGIVHIYQQMFMQALRCEHPNIQRAVGGVDFALVDVNEIISTGANPEQLFGKLWRYIKNRKPILAPVTIEHNGGRTTGATTAIYAANRLGISSTDLPYANITVTTNSSFVDAWSFVRRNNLHFDPFNGSDGIIPWSWIEDSRGVHTGSLLVVAERPEDLVSVQNRSLEMMERAGILRY